MLFLYPLGTHAQSMDDLLRYTRTELKGTARYVSMSGAFNALGGDFSAIKDNPAAAAVFLNSEIGLTLKTVENKLDAKYFGSSNSVDSRSSDIDQFGLVLVLSDTEASDFVKLTFAYNYQDENTFNSKFNARGTNPNRGLDDYFLAFANGIPYRDIKTYDDEDLSQSYKYLGESNGFGSQQAFWDIKAMSSIRSQPMTTTPNMFPTATRTSVRSITIFLSPTAEKTANTPFHLAHSTRKISIWVLTSILIKPALEGLTIWSKTTMAEPLLSIIKSLKTIF